MGGIDRPGRMGWGWGWGVGRRGLRRAQLVQFESIAELQIVTLQLITEAGAIISNDPDQHSLEEVGPTR